MIPFTLDQPVGRDNNSVNFILNEVHVTFGILVVMLTYLVEEKQGEEKEYKHKSK